MADRIIVRDLQVYAHHGLLPEESALGQRFALDIEAEVDLRPAGRSDDLALGVSYADIVAVAAATLRGPRHALIEAVAESVARDLLAAFPALDGVALELRKPGAPIDAVFAHVAVAITRRRDA